MSVTVSVRRTAVANNTAGTNTYAFSPSSNATAGATLVLVVTADNAGSQGSAVNINSVADTQNNIWTKRQSPIYDNGAASAGIEGAWFDTQQTVGTLTTSDTITVTFGSNTTAKAVAVYELYSSDGHKLDYLTGGVGTGATAANGQITTATMYNNHVVLAAYHSENVNAVTGDSDTTNGSWDTQQTVTVGTGTAGIRHASQTKVVTGTGTQSYDVTVASQDRIVSYVAYREVAYKTFTVDAVLKRTYEFSFTVDAVLLKTINPSFTVDAEKVPPQVLGNFTLDAVINKTIGGTFGSTRVRDVGSQADESGNTLTVGVPAGSEVGDLLQVYVAYDITGAGTPTVSGGWTKTFERINWGAAGTVAWHRLQDGSVTEFTHTLATSNQQRGVMVAYTNGRVDGLTGSGSNVVDSNTNITSATFADFDAAFSTYREILRTAMVTTETGAEIIDPDPGDLSRIFTSTGGGPGFVVYNQGHAFGSSLTTQPGFTVSWTGAQEAAWARKFYNNPDSLGFTVNAFVQAAFTVDAEIVGTGITGDFSVDAAIHKLWQETFTLDAVQLASSGTKTFTLDAVVHRLWEKSLTTDAVLLRAMAGTPFTADAVIHKPIAGTPFALDAVIHATSEIKAFTLDAVVNAHSGTKTFTLDAVLLKTISGTPFALDAVQFAPSGDKTFTADAELARRTYGDFTLDAVVLRGQTGTPFALDAVIHAPSGTKTFTVDAVRHAPSGTKTFTVDALIVQLVWGDDFNRVTTYPDLGSPDVGYAYTTVKGGGFVWKNGAAWLDSYSEFEGGGGIAAGLVQFDYITTTGVTDYIQIFVGGSSLRISYSGIMSVGAYGSAQEANASFFPNEGEVWRVKGWFGPVSGGERTTRVKAWKIGTAEPGWQNSRTGSTSVPAKLRYGMQTDQGPGAVTRYVGSVFAWAVEYPIWKLASFSLDAWISKTVTGTPFTLDALILAHSGTQALSLDAILLKLDQPVSFTADAVVQRAFTGNVSLDAVIHREQSGTPFTVDAVHLASSGTKSVTLDAWLVATRAFSFATDAVLLREMQGTPFTLDAWIPGAGLGAFTVDAVVHATISDLTFTLDAVTSEAQAGDFTLDAALLRTTESALSVDAVTLASSGTKAFTVDAVIREIQGGTFPLDSVVQRTTAESFDLDAILTATIQPVGFTLDAMLAGAGVGAFTLDAIQSRSSVDDFTLDAELVGGTRTGSFSLQAIVSGVQSVTFSVDAVVAATSSGSFPLDAVQLKTEELAGLLDAVVQATRMGGFATDAVLLSPQTGSFSVDAWLVGGFTLDAYIAGQNYFTVDASISRRIVQEIEATVSARTIAATLSANVIEATTSARTIAATMYTSWHPTRQASLALDAEIA